MTNPTDTIIALEKALEAATPGAWLYRAKSNTFHKPPPEGTKYTYGETILSLSSDEDETPQQAADMEFLLAVVNPVAIRTLLDAHASALRDAERLKKALAEIVSASYDKSVRPLAVHLVVESARAALDDNTKGAASALSSLDQLP